MGEKSEKGDFNWEDYNCEDYNKCEAKEGEKKGTVYVSYDTFDELMNEKYPTYDWEKIIVTTRDGYELAMYHIYNKTARLAANGSKGPIMWMHGGGQDPKNFLEYASSDAPLIQMADLGHDIYMPSNRGNPDSLGHASNDYNYNFDMRYWDYTLTEQGNDIVDAAKAMFSSAATGKGYYFGYSKGTAQALIALALQKSEMATYFNRIVLLAPCTFTQDGLDVSKIPFSKTPGIYEQMNEIGINSIGTYDWETNK